MPQAEGLGIGGLGTGTPHIFPFQFNSCFQKKKKKWAATLKAKLLHARRKTQQSKSVEVMFADVSILDYQTQNCMQND